MKRTLFSILLMVAAMGTAFADDYTYLTVTSTSVEQSFQVDQLRRITFEDGNMVVATIDGNSESIALETLNRLMFTATPTAIRNLSTESCKSLQLQSDRVVVNGKGLLKLYNTNGQLVRQTLVNGSTAELSLDGLPRGIYIARIGTQSLKLAH